MNRTSKAWKIAEEAHKGQKRFNRQPYITHIHSVVNILEKMGYEHNPDILIPAILHDVIEDGGDKYCKIIKQEFGTKIVSKVLFLTHMKDDTYLEYIDRLCNEKDCIIIKIADMIQNLTENPKVKQREKYLTAFPILMDALINKKYTFA